MSIWDTGFRSELVAIAGSSFVPGRRPCRKRIGTQDFPWLRPRESSGCPSTRVELPAVCEHVIAAGNKHARTEIAAIKVAAPNVALKVIERGNAYAYFMTER